MKMDFASDIAAQCKRILIASGCRDIPKDNEQLIVAYCEMRLRRVASQARDVEVSGAFSVPPHLAKGVRILFDKVEHGDDIWPHQSRKILSTKGRDGMLYDFGVHHFHLGVAPDPKHPNLVQGTPELLFACVTPKRFYAIGIFDHESWTDLEVLDIAHRNWPELLDPFRLRGIKGPGRGNRLSNTEVASIRGHGANAGYTSVDGLDQFGPPGGGQTTASTSFRARLEADRLIHHARSLELLVRNKVTQVQLQRGLQPAEEVQLFCGHHQGYAIASPTLLHVAIEDSIALPPL